MQVRRPVVAGQFYESDRRLLEGQIRGCFLDELGPGKLPYVKNGKGRMVGLVAPHAGYTYSGPVAANAYHSLASDGMHDTFIIIGPNHTGMGSPIAVMKSGKWATPFGDVEIDSDVAENILEADGLIADDARAHSMEHSIEVQVPFLQFVYKKVKFVPICMMDQSYDVCVGLSEAIEGAVMGRDAVVIASSDFSHYVPYDTAYAKDLKALDCIKNLDARKFYDTVERLKISACGYGPIATMLLFARKAGARGCDMLKYATSGDITGDKDEVVGYCSASVVK